jgi:hypothetical protein
MQQAARWKILCWWSWYHRIPLVSSVSQQNDVGLVSASIWKGSFDAVHGQRAAITRHGYPLDDATFAADPSWLKDLCRAVLATNWACRSAM